MSDTAAKCEQVIELIRSWGNCAVAFSAGVDSTVVAKAAQLALGERAVAVTGRSVSPPIDVTLELLGKEHTLGRIDRALEYIRARADRA